MRLRGRRGVPTFRPMTLPEHPIVLVTGSSDGIGRTTAVELAKRGARVIAHGRRADRVAETVALLRRHGRAEPLDPLVIDLGRLADVRNAGALLDERGVRVDVLLNNAGVFMNERVMTADGFEQTFAVNHLAPFALTHALLSSQAGGALRRIVNVSSIAHTRGSLDLDDLSYTRRRFDPYGAYAASKLANVLFTVELARRLRGRDIAVNALHPGVVSTKLLTEGFGMQGDDSLEEASVTSVRLSLDADLASVTGGYFANGKPAQMNPVARDEKLARRFYEISAKLAGVSPVAPP